MKRTLIHLDTGGFNQTVRDFLAGLLNIGMAASVMVPKRTTGGDNYVQALVKNPDMLSETDVSVTVMPVQAARLISNLAAGR